MTSIFFSGLLDQGIFVEFSNGFVEVELFLQRWLQDRPSSAAASTIIDSGILSGCSKANRHSSSAAAGLVCLIFSRESDQVVATGSGCPVVS